MTLPHWIRMFSDQIKDQLVLFWKFWFRVSGWAVRPNLWANFSGGFWGPRPPAPAWCHAQIWPPEMVGFKIAQNRDCGSSTDTSRSLEYQGTLFFEIGWNLKELHALTRVAKSVAGREEWPKYGHISAKFPYFSILQSILLIFFKKTDCHYVARTLPDTSPKTASKIL